MIARHSRGSRERRRVEKKSVRMETRPDISTECSMPSGTQTARSGGTTRVTAMFRARIRPLLKAAILTIGLAPLGLRKESRTMDTARLIGFARVTDYATARAFYEGKLGLEFVSEDGFALVLKSGGNWIRLSRSKGFTPGDYTILGWEVSGIEAAVAALAGKGVAFEKYPWVSDPRGLGIWTAPNGDKVAWFKDPDGNILSLSEHK